jgi:hypothetical protein
MKILSLGWGVQSFTMAAMVALGELEPIDAAIHADTTHEFSGTYSFVGKWTPWLEEHGIKAITVRNPIPNMDKLFAKKQIHIPAFTKSINKGDGQYRRTCTQRWKIAPMREWLQDNRNGRPVEQWLGISLDEFQRMKDSDVKYITNRYPLIEKRMTRNDCISWLLAHGLEVPPKSACVFCPYRNWDSWLNIMNSSIDWKDAVYLDNKLRNVRPPFESYVHPSRKPLESVDFRTQEEKGQMSLWDAECSGICGV